MQISDGYLLLGQIKLSLNLILIAFQTGILLLQWMTLRKATVISESALNISVNSRNAPFQQTMYLKHWDCAIHILGKISKMERLIILIMNRANEPLRRKPLFENYCNLVNELTDLCSTWSGLLPSSVLVLLWNCAAISIDIMVIMQFLYSMAIPKHLVEQMDINTQIQGYDRASLERRLKQFSEKKTAISNLFSEYLGSWLGEAKLEID